MNDTPMSRLRMYSYTEAEMAVIRWAEARKIIPFATPASQLLKAMSEMGELCDAEGKQDIAAIQDAVGDVMVCLINYCALRNIQLVPCLIGAYEQIKDRKGVLMPDGTFVKETTGAQGD
jgi:NTP pyrophosphatase (non-canonical NTP hydrolase)